MFRIGEVHFFPGHAVNSNRSAAQRSADWPDERPCRQPVDNRGGAEQVRLNEACIAAALGLKFLDPTHLLPIHIVHLPAEEELGVDLDHSSSSLPPPGMCSMMCLASHSSQSSAPVSFASTSSLTSFPTASTRDHGILTGSLRRGPQSCDILLASFPSAGWMRIHSVAPPITMWVIRGWLFSPTCMTKPLTLPIGQPSRSISFLSRTSRTSFTSASDDLEWNRDYRENEGNQNYDGDDGIADPAIAVLAEVNRIVHQEKEWHDGQRQRRGCEGHRYRRHLDRVYAEQEWNGREKNDERVDEREARVL